MTPTQKSYEAPTIDEMNRVIAEFMGLSFDSKKKDGSPYYTEKNKDGWVSKTYYNPQYNSSWESVMSVGKKIFDMMQEDIKKRPPHTFSEGDWLESAISIPIREYDIAGAHKKIYDFINWYNENK